MRKKKLKEAAQLENDTLDRFPPHGDVPFESLPLFIITTKDLRKGGLLLLAEQVRFVRRHWGSAAASSGN